MFAKSIIAAGALASIATAIPFNNHQHHHHQKRDVVWVTQTQEDVVTMQMTTTVWLDPGETAPAGYETPAQYSHHHSQVTSHVKSTVTVPAASSSPVAPVESSAPASSYVAPSSSSVYVTPSSSSVYVAPTTPATSYVAPTTSIVYTPPPAPTTSSAAAPAPSSYSGGGGDSLTGMAAPGKSYSGDLTYYAVGMGACGFESTPDQPVVAMSYTIFDAYNGANPNDNPLCNKTVTIDSPQGGSYTATIVDRCPGCEEGSLDLSQGFFTNFAQLSVGRLTGVNWKFDE